MVEFQPGSIVRCQVAEELISVRESCRSDLIARSFVYKTLVFLSNNDLGNLMGLSSVPTIAS